MKKAIFIFSLFFISFSAQAQEMKTVKKKKNAKVAFKVDGICGMCKKRIEIAALKTKGVKPKKAKINPKIIQGNKI